MATEGIRESELTLRIVHWLNQQPGIYARKVHSTKFSCGWPDIVGCMSGIMLALEVKRPGGRHPLTPLQAAELTKWDRVGAITGVVHSVDETDALLKRVDQALEDTTC